MCVCQVYYCVQVVFNYCLCGWVGVVGNVVGVGQDYYYLWFQCQYVLWELYQYLCCGLVIDVVVELVFVGKECCVVFFVLVFGD